jgi:hypothetical protein
MPATAKTPLTLPPPHPRDLFIGVLAALAKQGVYSLKIHDRVLHRAWGAALQVFRSKGGVLARLADKYYQDHGTGAFDELEHSIIAAEGSGYLRFPNPTYRKLQLTVSPRTAEDILARRRGFRATYDRAAKELLEAIKQ